MLTRETVTVASRIMLPVYVAFFGILGLNFLISPHSRMVRTPMLQYADNIMSLQVWGMLFLVVSGLMAEALFLHRRGLYQVALLVCAGSMTVWAVVGVFAAIRSEATPAGSVWPAFVVAACIATYRSLGAWEITRGRQG